MEATKHRATIKNNRLLIDLPESFNDSEVEVLVMKIKDLLHKEAAFNRFFSTSINVDTNIPFPNREERNAR